MLWSTEWPPPWIAHYARPRPRKEILFICAPQKQPCITGTTGDATRGDLRDGAGDTNCTSPSAAAAHGMGTLPLVGIIQQYAEQNGMIIAQSPRTTVEGTCPTSNIAAGLGCSTIHSKLGTWFEISTWCGGVWQKNNNSTLIGGHGMGDVVEYYFQLGECKTPD
jgi:hypothetical protein